MTTRALGLAVVVVALVGGSQGHAAHPGVNGDVVLVRIESGETPSGLPPASHALYTVAADGSEATLLADVPAYDPEWSPDGEKIAFWADSDDATPFEPAEW